MSLNPISVYAKNIKEGEVVHLNDQTIRITSINRKEGDKEVDVVMEKDGEKFILCRLGVHRSDGGWNQSYPIDLTIASSDKVYLTLEPKEVKKFGGGSGSSEVSVIGNVMG
jgi:hypothetical protein